MNFKNMNTKFAHDFLKAMTNDGTGQSLRKWLAVGSFWAMFLASVKFTDKDNLVLVLGVWSALIISLVVTYTAGNISEKKIDAKSDPPPIDKAE